MGDCSTIRSAANPALKRVRAVRSGTRTGLVLLEGDRLIEDARRSGLEFDTLLHASSRAQESARAASLGLPARLVEDALIAGVSTLEHSPGSLALVVAPRPVELAEIEVGQNSLLVVLAGVADPGNLGAIARTAEAAGAEALILAGRGCSPWNEKAVRASMGSLLRLPLVCRTSPGEVVDGLAAAGVRQLRAITRGGAAPGEQDWSGPLALWLSSETAELPPETDGFDAVSIAMAGVTESLNVGVAAGVLLFAAGRNGS